MSLTSHPGNPVRVSYRLAGTVGEAAGGGTASAGEYIVAHASGFVTFRTTDSNPLMQTITVDLRDDSRDEADETIRIELYRSGVHPNGAVISSSAGIGVGTIRDDDPEPEFYFEATNLSSGETSQTTLTVRRDARSDKEMSVQFMTVDGTAMDGTAAVGGMVCGAGADYITQSGTLTFAAGSATSNGKTIAVPNCDKAGHGHDRTFTVELSNPVNGSIDATRHPATVTIQESDALPAISVAAPDTSEAAGPLVFTATLTAASNLQVTVAYADAGTGTAASGTDYAAVTAGTLTFAPGKTEKTVSVALTDDNEQEERERSC